MKIFDSIAHFISFIFSPLLIPTYCMAIALSITYLYSVPTSTKWHAILTIFAITTAIPLIAIYILYRLKVVTDPGLNKQNERIIPYIITFLCYLGAALYIFTIHGPHWLIAFILGGAVANVVNFGVNYKWKISGHGAAMGGALALIFYISYSGINVWPALPWLYGTLLATGLTGWARLFLKRHTLPQVMTGILNGFTCVYIAMIIS